MAYSDFTLAAACETFTLDVDEELDLFARSLACLSVRSSAVLDEHVPLATSIHTEKARSEFIVAPDARRSPKADGSSDQPVLRRRVQCRSRPRA